MFSYSIVIPYRDTLDMLYKSVLSIPDRDDIQVIIIDNSAEPLPKEKVPSKKHASLIYTTSSSIKGAGCARNEGLRYAEGKFVVFLDADDYFTQDAFVSFDKYLETDYDIIYFDADSIRLNDGSQSNRHANIHRYISSFKKNRDDKQLRYRFVNPVAKMIRNSLIRDHNILFEEVTVSNDAMFSVKTGHYANKVTACEDVVYIITEGEKGSSLTRTRNVENMYTRYQVAVRRYRFITEVGQKDMRPRLSGYIKYALFHFGPKEFLRYLLYARKNHVSIWR
jgi:glycosyltransferase involved in cell wall biosynthesis